MSRRITGTFPMWLQEGLYAIIFRISCLSWLKLTLASFLVTLRCSLKICGDSVVLYKGNMRLFRHPYDVAGCPCTRIIVHKFLS